MKGKKYLAKNIALLTISQLGSKLLSFFLVPLYTSVLSTGEYGIYDLFNTTILLVVPIFTSNISDATLRFPLDNKEHSSIFSTSLKHVIRGTAVFFLLLLFNYFGNFFPTINEYKWYLLVMFVTSSLGGIITNFARGIDGIKEVAISGIIGSAVLLSLNIYFLLELRLGISGYFLANILGLASIYIYLFFALKMWKYIKKSSNSLKEIEKQMLDYAGPLLTNNIAWWVNSSSDRYVVTWLSGVSANGIYSVGYKIPTILNVFQTIFNQAWTLSAVKDFDPEDTDGFFTNMYNLYNFSMLFMCSVLITLTRLIANILYAKAFYEAWMFVPFLLISVLFGALSGYVGGIFAAVKATKIFGQTTILTAVVNTILNIVLVYFIGPLGAALSTMIAYFLTWLIRIFFVRKYIKLKLNFIRDTIAYLILLIQSLCLFLLSNNSTFFWMIESVFIILIIILYKEQCLKIYQEISKFMKGKLKNV